MRYPDGRCGLCGEREYTTTDGSLWCPNCAQRDESSADIQSADTDRREH